MFRILFFVAIAAVIYFGWRPMRMKQIELERRLAEQEKVNKGENGEKMVSCDYCGVYVPVSEAVKFGEKNYCSEEHRRAAQRR